MVRLGRDKYTEEIIRLLRDNPSISQTYQQALQISKGELSPDAPELTEEIKKFVELVDEDDIETAMHRMVEIARDRMRILSVDVISAVHLTRQQSLDLEQRLVKMSSRQVVIHNIIDTHIIGGLRIIIGDTVIDNSIRTQLEKIKQELYKGVYFKDDLLS